MLQKGIELSDEKIGADILLISNKSEFPKTEFLYTSLPSRRYIHKSELEFLNHYDEIEKITYQFFTHTLSEGCCSTTEKTRVIGFDQDSDYIIKPWLREQKIDFVQKDSVIIGTDIALKPGEQISLLGKVFTISGKLNPTGTGLDHTIFMDINTSRDLAKNKFNKSVFKGNDPQDLVTSVYLKLKPQSSIHSLVENINATQDKVMATSKAESIEHIKLQIEAWRNIVIFLTVSILLLAIFSLYSRYDNMIRTRTKEIGYMKAMGMGNFQILMLCTLEIFMISMFSSFISSFLAIIAMPGITKYLKSAFAFPISDFNLEIIFFILLISALISVVLSFVSAWIPVFKISSMQPKDAMNRGQL